MIKNLKGLNMISGKLIPWQTDQCGALKIKLKDKSKAKQSTAKPNQTKPNQTNKNPTELVKPINMHTGKENHSKIGGE